MGTHWEYQYMELGLALRTCVQTLLKSNQHSFDRALGLGLRLERTPALQPERKSGPGRELALDLDMVLGIDLDVDLNVGVGHQLNLNTALGGLTLNQLVLN